MMRQIAALFLVLSCLQAVRAAEAPPVPTVSVKFTIIGWNGEPAALAYRQEGKFVPLEVAPFARSKVYKYTGPARLDIYASSAAQKSEEPDAKKNKVGGSENTDDFVPAEAVAPKFAKEGAIKVDTIEFPVGPKRFTVLIGGAGGRYGHRLIVDDETEFPLGVARVFNLTATRMLLRYNQQSNQVIPSGTHALVRPRPDHQLVAETAFERAGKWKRSNDDFIYTPPDAQTSVFYFESNEAYFKSIDGGSRDIQLIVLREKTGDDAAK